MCWLLEARGNLLSASLKNERAPSWDGPGPRNDCGASGRRKLGVLRKPKGRSLGERAEQPGEAAGEAEGGVQVCRYARIRVSSGSWVWEV